MKLLVAVDRKWGIGNKGHLLVQIPEDMKQFRTLTEKNVIILGRKTLKTFPSEMPLLNRKNVVLSTKTLNLPGDSVVAKSVEEALEIVKDFSDDRVFVVGGESVYEQFMPYVDEAYVTYIDYDYEADAHFPNLDESGDWEMVYESDEKTYFDVEYYFRKYVRKNV